jgi:acyl-coenzyme A synthetase/AMP-(fatty) acid ligase
MAEVLALAADLPDCRHVINLHTDRYLYLRAFCAALVRGQCTLMPPNRKAHTLQQLQALYDDTLVVGEAGAEPLNLSKTAAAAPDISDELHAAIAFTSGSTGSPTPNLKYWRSLREGAISNARMVIDAASDTISMVATVPPQHMWGMETSIMLPLFADIAVSYAMPFYPQDIADTLQRLPGPRMLVSSPIHLDTFMKSGVECQGIDKIITATAPLSRQLAADLEERFNTRVQDVFGCSESGILATRRTSLEDVWRYSDTFELTLMDDGVNIAAPHLSEDVLLPDIVELLPDARFRWIGRRQDMVNIAGKRGSLADLNFRLQEIDGVVDGVIFEPATGTGRQGRLAALVVAPDRSVSDILGALNEKVETVFLPRPLLKVATLPRQETGKLALKAVQALFDDIQDSE